MLHFQTSTYLSLQSLQRLCERSRPPLSLVGDLSRKSQLPRLRLVCGFPRNLANIRPLLHLLLPELTLGDKRSGRHISASFVQRSQCVPNNSGLDRYLALLCQLSLLFSQFANMQRIDAVGRTQMGSLVDPWIFALLKRGPMQFIPKVFAESG